MPKIDIVKEQEKHLEHMLGKELNYLLDQMVGSDWSKYAQPYNRGPGKCPYCDVYPGQFHGEQCVHNRTLNPEKEGGE